MTSHQAHHLSPMRFLCFSMLLAASSPAVLAPAPVPARQGGVCCSLLPSLEEQRVWAVLRQSTGCLFGFLGYYTACSNNHIFLLPVGPNAAERKCGMAEVKHQPGNSWGHQPQPLCATWVLAILGTQPKRKLPRPGMQQQAPSTTAQRLPSLPPVSWGHRHGSELREELQE